MNRREFLLSSAATLAAAVTSGCAQRDGLRHVPAHPYSRKRAIRIDSHAHIFNSEDLNAYSYIAQDLRPNGVLSALYWPIRILGKGITMGAKWGAPGRHLEEALLDNLLDRRDTRKKKGIHPKTRTEQIALLEQDMLELIRVSDRASKLNRRRDAATRGEKHVSDEVLAEWAAELVEIENRARDLGGGTVARSSHPFVAFGQKRMQNWLGGLINSMLSYRLANALNLMKRYPDVDLFVPATLDFDAWFHGNGKKQDVNPSEPLDVQARMMGKIAVLTEGRVLSRTGFCPMRQAKWDCKVNWAIWQGKEEYHIPRKEPVAIVKEACEEHGSLGAKLYPVLGYRPMGNRSLPNSAFRSVGPDDLTPGEPQLTPYGDEIGTRLDESMHKLLKVCESGTYTIMAHTNHSHGLDNDTMERTGPDHWGEVLAKYRKVNMNMGHFGGFGDGLDANGAWPLKIAESFERNPNLYADCSFVNAPRANPKTNDLAYLFEKFPAARARLMYGTDWHELLSSTDSYSYFGKWDDAFAENPQLAPHRDAFFGANAARFHGIQKGGAARSRLERGLFAKYGVKPDWAYLV